ncbi:unnamed protein product, partial [marine sediment metagenome]
MVRKITFGRFDITYTNRAIYGTILIILMLIGFGVYVSATWDTSKNVYHDSADIKVNIDGTDYDLQEAITDGLIGGG